jgi:hypothetical protein
VRSSRCPESPATCPADHYHTPARQPNARGLNYKGRSESCWDKSDFMRRNTTGGHVHRSAVTARESTVEGSTLAPGRRRIGTPISAVIAPWEQVATVPARWKVERTFARLWPLRCSIPSTTHDYALYHPSRLIGNAVVSAKLRRLNDLACRHSIARRVCRRILAVVA